MTSPVGIVIPIYRDLGTVKRCLDSVLCTVEDVETELVLINDGSPDRDLVTYCRQLGTEKKFRLIEHPENRGFVASVNEGIAALGDRDVIILNSDTEVPPRWIERLLAAAEGCPNAASITPFSNNATICSYPSFCEDNAIPDGLSHHELDMLFNEANRGVTIDIPTGVGFCMFMRRAAIEDVGVFDQQAFGRGYGEENDWCLRATSKGWKHVLCADLFVYHAGGVSFGAEAQTLQANALQIISERYPDYQQQIGSFIEEDPIEPARRAVDSARPDHLAVINEYRQREQTLRASRYELDRQRHAQVVKLDEILEETREVAESERRRYEELLATERQLVSYREAQYQAQLKEMAAGYRSLETSYHSLETSYHSIEAELTDLNRFWPVRAWRWVRRKAGRS